MGFAATEKALRTIESYRKNKIIMDFVTLEAREKVAGEIREVTGSKTTAKAVELLSYRKKNISERVDKYIAAGLVGCYLASLKA